MPENKETKIDIIQEASKKNAKPKLSAASKDAIILILVVVLVFILSYFFNVFYFLVQIFSKNSRALLYIDEIVTVLLTACVGMTIFSWRRWREFRNEAAKRLKNQEMLREVAETKAEVERIISKQLRADMDQLKNEVKEILYLLNAKRKQ
ncbi:MAG: hypothetical protein PHP17_02715 [Candidatus Omnitrophica bacterium]|nr:hypothetical protein [Candidatus Omnitrophota bacterium]